MAPGGAAPAVNPGAPAVTTAALPTAAPISAPPPPPVAGPGTLTAAANGASYEQLLAAGWTDETLRANGLMV